MKTKHIFVLIFFIALSACDPEVIEKSPGDASSLENAKMSTPLARAALSGSFSVMTYNVAGLPEGLSSSNPEANTPLIGQRVRNFDIVHVQEDFNYHASLYANDNHPHRTPTSGGVPFGDGLNTLSRFWFEDFKRVKWNSCNGTDCLTPKGFTFMRIRIDEGIYIDFYNAHTNAGTENADLAARRSNISQLSQFINQNSAGNAVIVMGDLNCRYTRSGDNIRELITNNGLTDTWIQLVRNGDIPQLGSPDIACSYPNINNDCEVVDKIFYRDSRSIDLTPSNYQLNDPAFVTASGEPLSDHFPVITHFSWHLQNGLLQSDLFGGPHGTPFNDLEWITSASVANKFIIRAGSRVDGVGVQLTDGTVLKHGGTGGTERTLTLNAGEYVREIKLCSGQRNGHTRIFYIELRTNHGRVLSGGSQTSSTVTYTAPDGWRVTGFFGNSGSEVDKLGVIYSQL